MKIIINKTASCPVCSLPLSQEMNQAIFYRKLSNDVILTGINERLGVFITEKDLEKHREKHMGFEMEKVEVPKEINEIEEIDERIVRVKAKLKQMEDRGEIYSHGYQGLNKTLTDLIKNRNEIREGTKHRVEGRVSVYDWVKNIIKEKGEEGADK